MRTQGTIKAAVKEVSGGDTEYTVVITANEKDIETRWIWEYGVWRLRSFGEVAAGNKDLLAQKEAERKNRKAPDIGITVEAGFAHLIDKAPAALYASIDYRGLFGAQVYFAGSRFSSVGVFAGLRTTFQLDKIGITPSIRGGIDIQSDQEFKAFEEAKKRDTYYYSLADVGLPVSLMARGDVKLSLPKIPGLRFGAGFQFNFFNLMSDEYKDASKMVVTLSAGYEF
jgi:hypothetical protein